jgi:peptidyl-prolyl cis-trans isomerase SurA
MLIQQFHDRREGEPPRHIEPAWIDAQIAEEQEKRFGGDPQKFLEHLQQRGQTMSDYRKDVEEGIIVSYMRAQEKKVAARTDVPKTPEPERPLHLRIIQLNRTSGETDAVLLEKANAILERLKQGEAFGQLATEFDQSGRRARGGDWGWLGAADFKATFRDIAMALQKGAVSAPIITPDGCFLLYAEDRR